MEPRLSVMSPTLTERSLSARPGIECDYHLQPFLTKFKRFRRKLSFKIV